MPKILVLGLFAVLYSVTGLSDEAKISPNNHQRMSNWMSNYFSLALEKGIIANVNGLRQASGSLSDQDNWGLPGAVIAAASVEHDPHRRNPSTGQMGVWQDYRGVWKRDAALTMRLIFRLMSHGPWEKWTTSQKVNVIGNYVQFSETEQATHRVREPIEWGGEGSESLKEKPLSEPLFDLSRAKVNAFGQENLLQWGEPQDDGPPLQTIAILDALKVLAHDQQNEIEPSRTNVKNTALRVLRRNIRFMMQTIPQSLKGHRPYFERWEENYAELHFAVLIEQRYALLKTKKWFLKENSPDQFELYFGYTTSQVDDLLNQIELALREKFLKPEKDYIIAHHNIRTEAGLVREKPSLLDVQVLMASLETNKFGDSNENHYLAPNDPWMRSTFYYLDLAFNKKYQINGEAVDLENNEEPLRGAAWGRYPEDHQHFDGDPWFIASFTKVQFLLWDAIKATKDRLITVSKKDVKYFDRFTLMKEKELEFSSGQDQIQIPETDDRFKIIVQGLVAEAKANFFRIMVHAGNDGSLSEVFHQQSGKPRGIQNLTWSWVELLKTIRMLKRASNEPLIKDILKIEVPTNACNLALEEADLTSQVD